MPEFEIYPRNLRRHKNKQTNKQTKVTEQNSPVFALKIDFLAFASISKTLLRSANAIRTTFISLHLTYEY